MHLKEVPQVLKQNINHFTFSHKIIRILESILKTFRAQENCQSEKLSDKPTKNVIETDLSDQLHLNR